jgi:hypothetical protein
MPPPVVQVVSGRNPVKFTPDRTPPLSGWPSQRRRPPGNAWDAFRGSTEVRTMRDKRLTLATWLVVGAGVGVALGLAMGNLALWLAIGVGIGLALGAGQSGMGRK